HFPVGSFCIIESMTDLNTAIAKADYTPGILKTARGGYDGLGQVLVWTAEELVDAWSKLGQVPCVLERKLTLESELSVLVARGQDGAVAAWPVQENQHCNGILDVSIVPARQSPELISQAVAEAERLLCLLDYVGVMAVEFFVHRTPNGALEIALNEIAPRPHNSGHYSIEACQTSQFEQQVRTLCGLPLGNTLQHAPAVMVNLLGDIWLKQEPDFHACLSIDGVKLHLYGKSEARAGRKMGHITCLGTTVEEALDKAMRVKKILHIASKADN
ncbi:MAG: N5-carboxyaminoimidazole ribonucleotide synthase, partial [Pseudomonadota bacterium]